MRELPEGWRIARLGELVALEYGKALPEQRRSSGDYPIVGSSGVTGRNSTSLIPGPAVIIGRKGTVGSITWVDSACWPIDTTFWVYPKANVDFRWLYWELHKLDLKSLTITTGVPGLNRQDAHGTQVLLPPKGEQRRIAEILDTIDSLILTSESLVAKTELALTGIQRSLLADLKAAATSSVGHHFDIKAGITLGPDRLPRSNATPYLRVANVQRARIDLEDVALLQASSAERRELALQQGDLLVVEGHANPDEIGRCAGVQAEAVGLLYQNHLFRLRANHIDPMFAELWLNSEVAKGYWRRMCATSSGLYTINSKMLMELPFPAIPIDEQRRIASGLSHAQRRITTERSELEKLQALKRGLMEDLLTGRVRVPEAEAVLENL